MPRMPGKLRNEAHLIAGRHVVESLRFGEFFKSG